VLRGFGEGDSDRDVEGDEDGELEGEGAGAAERVHAGLPVGLHELLLAAFRVAVLLVELLDPGLERLHRAGLAELADGKGERDDANDDRESDQGKTKLEKRRLLRMTRKLIIGSSKTQVKTSPITSHRR